MTLVLNPQVAFPLIICLFMQTADNRSAEFARPRFISEVLHAISGKGRRRTRTGRIRTDPRSRRNGGGSNRGRSGAPNREPFQPHHQRSAALNSATRLFLRVKCPVLGDRAFFISTASQKNCIARFQLGFQIVSSLPVMFNRTGNTRGAKM